MDNTDNVIKFMVEAQSNANNLIFSNKERKIVELEINLNLKNEEIKQLNTIIEEQQKNINELKKG